MSACGRNWYLTEAAVEEGLLIKPSDKQKKLRIYSGKLYDLFLLLTCMVDYDKAVDVVETACFHFTDIDEHFVLKVILSSKLIKCLQAHLPLNQTKHSTDEKGSAGASTIDGR